MECGYARCFEGGGMGERSMVGKQSAWPEGGGYVTCSCAADGPGPPILATYHTPGEYVHFALARGKRILAGEIIPVVMVNDTKMEPPS